MTNETCSNYTLELANDSSTNSFYIKLFAFSGMLVSVIFIPTHLFLLYVTDYVESAKGKNFLSLMVMLLIKYLLILLNTTLDIPYFMKFPNVLLFGLVYVHLSSTCWLCIITEHSLNIIRKNIWKTTYNIKWIPVSVSAILGWLLPIFFILFAYLSSVTMGYRFCQKYCFQNVCQMNIFFVTFELIRLFLLIKSSIDIIRVKYYTSYITPNEVNEETINDLDYINFSYFICIVFYISWILEIVVYFLGISIPITVSSIVSSIEAILIVLGTLWWKKSISSENHS